MTTWKTIALTRQTFVGKVMSLLLTLNLQVIFGRIDIITMLNLPIHETSMFLYLLRWKKRKWKLLSCVWLFATPIQSVKSPGQNIGVKLFSLPGDLPNPGLKPRSPTLQTDSLPAEPQGKPLFRWGLIYFISVLWFSAYRYNSCFVISYLSISFLKRAVEDDV